MTEEQEEVVWAFLKAELKSAPAAGRRVQETCRIEPDFFRRFTAEQIPEILRRWKLVETIQRSQDAPVVVTADGLWRQDGTRWS
jgi:hypothetical protein